MCLLRNTRVFVASIAPWGTRPRILPSSLFRAGLLPSTFTRVCLPPNTPHSGVMLWPTKQVFRATPLRRWTVIRSAGALFRLTRVRHIHMPCKWWSRRHLSMLLPRSTSTRSRAWWLWRWRCIIPATVRATLICSMWHWSRIMFWEAKRVVLNITLRIW